MMNLQRPLAAEDSVSASASSQGDGDVKPIVSSLGAVNPSTGKKRPGPKRDSKPAPSEKLERNRQAQRTHRERKEQYTKDLELELSRTRELFVNSARERDAANQARDDAFKARDHLLEENQRLREMLQMSAASTTSGTDSGYDGCSVAGAYTRTNSLSTPGGSFPPIPLVTPSQSTAGPMLSTSAFGMPQQPANVWEISESRGFASDGPYQDTTASTPIKLESREGSAPMAIDTIIPNQQPVDIDYDELALDFVLTLERPCMGHLQYLTVRAHNSIQCPLSEVPGQPMEVPDDGENQHISGHALMATAPSYSHIQEHPSERYPAELPQVQREDLLRLLNLSSHLQVTDAELPPVKAWIRVMQDERFALLSRDDLRRLKDTLARKVHCYRFGAVLEERDIMDALHEILDVKNELIAPVPFAG